MRYLNALGCAASYAGSVITGKPVLICMPAGIGIEITNYCNLRCPECLSGSGKMTRSNGFMKRSLFNRIIAELNSYLLNINLYFQGESMMHPEFFDFIESTGNTGVTVSTNGHFLSSENAERLAGSRLRKLIVSLDGMDQEKYSIYRINGDFGSVIKGIETVSDALRKSGSKMRFEIQFLVNRHNEQQIAEAVKFARKVNAILRLKSMQIINHDHMDNWLPENKKFRRYVLNNGVFIIRNSLKNRCSRLWISPVITWNGKVVPCCFDKNAEHILGDLNESTFREVWYGERFMEFRKSLLTHRSKIEICRNCTTGLRGVIY